MFLSGVAFPGCGSALSFLRCRGARGARPGWYSLAHVFAQPANLFQALGLAHVQLKLQLEQLVREIRPWWLQLVVR